MCGIVLGNVCGQGLPDRFTELAFDACEVDLASIALAKLLAESAGCFARASENQHACDETVESTDYSDEHIARFLIAPLEIISRPACGGGFAR